MRLLIWSSERKKTTQWLRKLVVPLFFAFFCLEDVLLIWEINSVSSERGKHVNDITLHKMRLLTPFNVNW